MTPKEFLKEKGINPIEPIHWYGEDEFITLDSLLKEYADQQLILHGVSVPKGTFYCYDETINNAQEDWSEPSCDKQCEKCKEI